jgi:hypothetical protein
MHVLQKLDRTVASARLCDLLPCLESPKLRLPWPVWNLTSAALPDRAKDMPVFVTWWIKLSPIYPLSILAHQLRRRFLPNSSLLRGARSIYQTARPEGSLVFRPLRPGILEPKSLEAKTVQCSAALLGSTTLASRFAHQSSEEPQEPRRARGRYLFRRLFPAGPR